MGIKERRYNEIAEMKKKIMDAAKDIINQEGYDNLSIRKIADKIEYSPPTIYIYYKDKAEIISDMSNNIYSNVETNIINAISENSSLPIDQLIRKILLTFIESLLSEPEISKALMNSSMNIIFGGGDTSIAPSNNGIDILTELVNTGIEQNKIKSNFNDMSWMTISALLGFVMCAIENNLYKLPNFHEISDAFLDMLLNGIFIHD